jgi:hypothetical protein
MINLRLCVALIAGLLTTGCVAQWKEFIGETPATNLVPPRTVDGAGSTAPIAAPARATFAPAGGDTAMRVDFIGRKVLNANSQAGLQPFFATAGCSQPELFHRGVTLYITEGLVKQCQTEGQLAAVLSFELARMVAEREALATPQTRRPERRPPPDVPFGNSGQGSGAFDQVREAELVKTGAERRRAVEMLPPPDAKVLARMYLKKAGYPEAELDAVEPLLAGARANCTLENQVKAAPAASPWTPSRK